MRTPQLFRFLTPLCAALAALVFAPVTTASPATGEPPRPGMLERLLNPDKAAKNEFEGKSFEAGGGVAGRQVKTSEYAGVKSFGGKNFETREYQGGRQSWMDRLLFRGRDKNLPENLRGANRDASKKFETKELTTKNFEGGDRQSRLGSTEAFPVRDIKPKGTTQGAIDNDRQLQEKIKKGLTVDDVRNLLNKAP